MNPFHDVVSYLVCRKDVIAKEKKKIHHPTKWASS
jgi:hypothetical protein